MSDLRDLPALPDLAGDVRDRTVLPPYDEVTHRVRARRRRTAAGTLLAAALVVGGVGVWQHAASPAAGPAPATSPGPGPELPVGSWRQVVEGTDAHPFEISGSDDGSVAVVWRALEPGSPTFALVVRDAGGDVHGRFLEEPVTLTPVPGGWVGTYSSRNWLITTHGGWTLLPEAGASRDPRPGDVVVKGQYSSWLYSPGDGSLSALRGLDGGLADAYVTTDGHLVSCVGQLDGIRILGGGGSAPVVPGRTCVIVGRRDALAVVGLGDEPDGSIPMAGLATSTGRGWQLAALPDLLRNVSSVVVTPQGSTVVTDAGDGRWYLVRPDGTVTSPDRKAGLAFVAGDRLYVTPYGYMTGPLAWTDDDGRSWHETVLPGLEQRLRG